MVAQARRCHFTENRITDCGLNHGNRLDLNIEALKI